MPFDPTAVIVVVRSLHFSEGAEAVTVTSAGTCFTVTIISPLHPLASVAVILYVPGPFVNVFPGCEAPPSMEYKYGEVPPVALAEMRVVVSLHLMSAAEAETVIVEIVFVKVIVAGDETHPSEFFTVIEKLPSPKPVN